MTLAKRLTAAFLLFAFFGAGAVYAFPEKLLPQLFAAEVNLEKIYLNDASELSEITGAVQLNAAPAQNGAIVKAGDTIITGADGHATIVYFEDSVTRLAPGTTFKILQLERPAAAPLSGQIRGQLQKGSAWNKVVRPLDPQAVFAVESNTTVATIRGSAFDMTVGETGTSVASVEHGLELAVRDPATGANVFSGVLPEGQATAVDETQSEIQLDRQPIPPEVLASPWFAQNTQSDEAHVKTVEKKVAEKTKEALALPTNAAARFLQTTLQAKVDADRLAEATTPAARATIEAQIGRRELLTAEVTAAPVAERNAILQKFATNPALQNDLALVEKGYAQLPATTEDYALKAAVMELRIATAPEGEAKKAFEVRALRESVLDLQDDRKRADLTPAETQKLQNFETTLKAEVSKILSSPPTDTPRLADTPALGLNLQTLSQTLFETRATQTPTQFGEKNVPPNAARSLENAPAPQTAPQTAVPNAANAPKPVAPVTAPQPRPQSTAPLVPVVPRPETSLAPPPDSAPKTTTTTAPIAPTTTNANRLAPPPPTNTTTITSDGTTKTTTTTSNGTTGTNSTFNSTSTATSSGGGGGVVIVGDTVPPVVVDVTSSTPGGHYTVGQVIDLHVHFSEPITVSGTPTLALVTDVATGTTAVGITVLPMTSFGSNTLDFQYAVAAAHKAPDLETAGETALAFAGGRISDMAGNPANLRLPTPGGPHSLSAVQHFNIDTTAPVLTLTPPTTFHKSAVYELSEKVASATFTFLATGGPTDNNSPHVCTLGGAALLAGIHTNFELRTDFNQCVTWDDTLVDGATYTVTFAATDAAGNIATPVVHTNMLQDSSPPTTVGSVTAGTVGLNGWYTSDVTYTLAATDATSGVAGILFCLDLNFNTVNSVPCVPATSYTTPVVIATESPTNFVRWQAKDNAGNLTPVQSSAPLKVDKTTPVFTAVPIIKDQTSSDTTVTNSTTVNLFWNDADLGSSGVWAWMVTESSTTPGVPATNDPGWTSTPSLNYTFAPTVNGSKNFYFWLMDAAGNLSSMATRTVIFDPLAP